MKGNVWDESEKQFFELHKLLAGAPSSLDPKKEEEKDKKKSSKDKK
jgi:hypothetical protein